MNKKFVKESLFEEYYNIEDKAFTVKDAIYGMINGDGADFNGLNSDELAEISNKIGYDIYDLEDDEYFDRLTAEDIHRIHDILVELGYLNGDEHIG